MDVIKMCNKMENRHTNTDTQTEWLNFFEKLQFTNVASLVLSAYVSAITLAMALFITCSIYTQK